MRISLIHYRAGLMDGVSLEMEKWKKVLKSMGHDVSVIAGNKNEGVDITVPELMYSESDIEVFRSENVDINSIHRESEMIERRLEPIFRDFDLVIVNNIWSLALKIPLGLALERIVKNLEKPVIAHHHDFWWERDIKDTPSGYIKRILEEHFPPHIGSAVHLTINSLARDELKKRKGIDSVIVPNVFDFSKPLTDPRTGSWMRDELSLKRGDIVFLQATRIVPRKAIEITLELVEKFRKSSEGYRGSPLYRGDPFTGRVVLVFSGMCEDRFYMKKLMDIAARKGIEVIDASNYDFFGVYSVADVITYPSVLEGWGNQLLEAICAKKPVVLFEYEVFLKDIKSSGLKYVSLGREYDKIDGLVKIPEGVLERAVDELINIVFNAKVYNEMVDHNFEVGKRYFSLDRLRKILDEEIFPRLEISRI